MIETLSGPPVIEIRNIQEDEERTMAEVRRLQNAGANVPPELRSSGRVMGNGRIQKTNRMLTRKLSRVPSKKQDEGKIPLVNLHKLNPKNISAWNMKRLMK